MALEFFLQQFLTNPVPFAPMTKIHFELKEKFLTGEIDNFFNLYFNLLNFIIVIFQLFCSEFFLGIPITKAASLDF